MTKEQIQLEISRLDAKINISKNNILSCQKKISDLEDCYNGSNSMNRSYQDVLNGYFNLVVSTTKKLDRDSIFGENFKSKISSILGGDENKAIIEIIDKGKREILDQINELENNITIANRQITDYQAEKRQLEIELSQAI